MSVQKFYYSFPRNRRPLTATLPTSRKRSWFTVRTHKCSKSMFLVLIFVSILILAAIVVVEQLWYNLQSNGQVYRNFPYQRQNSITGMGNQIVPYQRRNMTTAMISIQEVSPTVIPDENISSVDYMACCGAGHRLSKMADAMYLARRLNFTLRGYWGYCDTFATRGWLTEVFDHLFGPQIIPFPTSNVYGESSRVSYSQLNYYARINNDVPGFHKLIRDGKQCDVCSVEKAKSDIEFYKNLRERFRLRSIVDTYYQNNLRQDITSNRTVVGIHIRAGNGELGDFSIRGRNINNVNDWLDNLAKLILKQSRDQNWRNAVLFIATDTPSLVDQLRAVIGRMKRANERIISVLKRDQFRPDEGTGVLFGQQGNIEQIGEDCLHGWEDTIIDMMLLSKVDILIAARPSSFTQSLPMSLVLAGEGKKRRYKDPYCEVNLNASKMKCFSNFTNWCCHGRTSFALQGIQRYEYLRMPGTLFATDLNSDDLSIQKKFKIQQRPESGCTPLPAGSKQVCLPYNWSNFVIKPRSLALESM